MDELSIHIALNNGDCTTLYVFARRKNTLFKSEDAKEYGESPFQLQEGCMYDFELDKNSYYLQEDRDILTIAKVAKQLVVDVYLQEFMWVHIVLMFYKKRIIKR